MTILDLHLVIMHSPQFTKVELNNLTFDKAYIDHFLMNTGLFMQ